MITGKPYDMLKFFALITLPALGVFYYLVSFFLNLPAVKEVLGIVLAVDVLLGIILQISSFKYDELTAKGTLVVTESKESKLFSLVIDGDPEYALAGKKRVVFNVSQIEEHEDPYGGIRKPRRIDAS